MAAGTCANVSYLARFFVIVSSLFYMLYCFVLIGDFGFRGRWNDEGHGGKFSYICEQSTATGICPDGWEFFGDLCYKHFTSPMTFQGAQSSCQQHSGNLATIPSAEVNSKMLELCEGAPFNSCRIGLHIPPNRTGREDGGWRWIADDSAPAYMNWALAEPQGGRSGANIFNSAKEPKVYIAGCSVAACFVCSITTAMVILGTVRICKESSDNTCMMKCGACGDCVCGGCLIFLAVILLAVFWRVDAALITLLPAVMMMVASGFGYCLSSQAEEEPAARVSVIGKPVRHHAEE
eukprot:TRINITY_DN53295_c0_g1_i1.p1 TRINITY_DN53295_c0_g1~~TRINITY_DN53295_c0_g1_i1.p1  ORF type:complete len:292 (-),score=28.87 TRINITY_DN53295_c0_g1_i1:21-896(-)